MNVNPEQSGKTPALEKWSHAGVGQAGRGSTPELSAGLKNWTIFGVRKTQRNK